jgi:putative peptidoglycan lipid II flippase
VSTTTSRAAAGIGAVAAVSRLAGFGRVLVLAAVLGTSYLGNAFQSANSLSNVLFELLAAGALSAVLVPTFVGLLEAGDDEGAEEVAGGVLGVAVVAMGSLSIAGILAAPLLARALTVGVPAHLIDDQRELVTFLLRFFIPQVVLYAAGTIAGAVLQAKRRFAIAMAAPIGNTVVMILALLLFGLAVDGEPTFDLTGGQRWLLVLAGTGGVVAFVGVLLAACRAAGFRLRPRWHVDARVREVLRHSGWGMVLHTGAGVLLGGAIVLGGSEEGAVVAYQVAWVFFLAPYAVLAQPVHTAILPELVVEARDNDLETFRRSVRWGLERIALLTIPVSAAMVALALPAMRAASFGEAAENGPGLLAAGLAGLAVGLFPYSAFLLLSRAAYALGDSRSPGVVSLASAGVGVVVMGIGSALTHGGARVAVLGAGHTLAYCIGLVVLGVRLQARVGGSLRPAGLARVVATSLAVGVPAWGAGEALLGSTPTRTGDVVVCAVVVVVAAGAVLLGYRASGLPGSLTPRGTREVPA